MGSRRLCGGRLPPPSDLTPDPPDEDASEDLETHASKHIDARTEITTELLARQGYSIIQRNEEDDEDHEEAFFAKDFERTFFSDETNSVICKTFIENALRDPISGEIGKSIIFCVSRKHATKITQILNEYADAYFPDKYQSDFAMQITSDVMGAQGYSINFQNNNLRGTTKFLDNYKSSKTRVCVTVGMMTTGYDCEDILNVGLLRPIFSPTDFIQIKGRGTRRYTFEFKEIKHGDTYLYTEEKERFKLFDFFGNCEYFEEEYRYDEELKLPRLKSKDGDDGRQSPPYYPRQDYEHLGDDPLLSVTEKKIGYEGMKIDRMFFERFEEAVKDDEYAREQYEQNNIIELERYIDEKIMNQPSEYYSWEKIRRSIGADRRLTIREILDKIFGIIPAFKTKAELINDEFETFSLTQSIPGSEYYDIRRFFEAYLVDKDVRKIISEKRYASLADCPTYTLSELKKLGEEAMQMVVDYVSDNVVTSRFAV